MEGNVAERALGNEHKRVGCLDVMAPSLGDKGIGQLRPCRGNPLISDVRPLPEVASR